MQQGQHWTEGENRILKKHYATLGAKGCVPLLPGRDLYAVRNRAARLGLRYDKGFGEVPEQTGGPPRYHAPWQPLKQQPALPVREGALDFRDLPSLT